MEVIIILNTEMLFSKGILFVRIKGDLNKKSIKELKIDDFKFIVLNINHMASIDSYSINYLNNLCKKEEIVLCDKHNISNKLLSNIPKIREEYDAYKLFERMI